VQALLHVPLQDLLPRSVLLDELGRVLRTVQRQGEGDFIGVANEVAGEVGEFDVEAAWGGGYKKLRSR
jgi:hypothetical protein